MGTGCKPVGVSLRWFESSPAHCFFGGLPTGDISKNFGIFYQLNLKQSITYQYLKHNYTSDRIICPDEDNLSAEDLARTDQTHTGHDQGN